MDPGSPKEQPSTNGLKKAFSKSNPSRSSLRDREDSVTPDRNSGVLSSDEPPKNNLKPATSGGSERDGGPSGISKLIPGARRRHRKKQEAGAVHDSENGSQLHNAPSQDSLSRLDVSHQRRRSMSDPGTNNLEFDGHSSRAGYNDSSPAIAVSNPAVEPSDSQNAYPEVAPSEASAGNSESASNHSGRRATRAATLGAPERNRSLSKSPSRGSLKGAFSPSASSRRSTSPDGASTKSSSSKKSKKSLFKSGRRSSLSGKKNQKPPEDVPPVPTPPNVTTTGPSKLPTLEVPPKTPPSDANPPPPIMATVTPPTPTDRGPENPTLPMASIVDSPAPMDVPSSLPPNAVVSPSGNMISHRRVRSASAAHQPHKLSNSMTSIEEGKTQGSRDSTGNQSGGFLSSMFSAAQNAASTLSNSLNTGTQPRMRSLTEPADMDKQTQLEPGETSPELTPEQSGENKKELAVETLGMGDLDFSHLGIDAAAGGVIKTNDGVVFTKMNQGDRSRKSTVSQRDEMAAKIEDVRAARAVTMAYEKPNDSTTSVAEDARPESQSAGKDSTEDHTPPNGSVHEAEVDDNLKRRESSVRNRRRRPRSGTANTTIGAIGAAVGGLALPGIPTGGAPRLTGFAVASKKRNRDFHQLFRSVPEDDYLIEDYSCALQREIILAGRIYISEGHICFSSNILGWVTTLVIGFDEVIAIEKESTAMVFPNAIGVKTLHARHTFRSLLSRDSTYDLMVNIWKINHPTLRSSVNGTQIAQGTGDKTEKPQESDSDSGSVSDDDEEVYDEDEEGEGGMHGADDSITGSEYGESTNLVNGKASTLSPSAGTPAQMNGDNDTRAKAKTSAPPESSAEFPGPKTHPPTEFTDPSGYYEKMMVDEIIPAPLGQVYSLVFGPTSGSFMTKFLLRDQKVTELSFDDDKKGLNNENRTRTYSYIKPLNASMGPKQTKCTSTETLDFLDLEKAVLVTLATQTPDVPNGNVFSVKTKYLFTWAQGNATRFYMSCTIEWTGKSWIKGPIEKGANDGQLNFGTDLVKALKSGVAPRRRLNGKGVSKGRGKRARPNTAEAEAAAAAAKAAKASGRQSVSWGLLEPLRGPLGPLVDTFQPLCNSNVAVGIIFMLLFMMWFRAPKQSSVGHPGVGFPAESLTERMIAYEELWRREESDLWDWLEERVGLDGLSFPVAPSDNEDGQPPSGKRPRRHRSRSELDLETRLRDEKMNEREIEDAIRVTNERLKTLQRVVEKRKRKHFPADENEATS